MKCIQRTVLNKIIGRSVIHYFELVDCGINPPIEKYCQLHGLAAGAVREMIQRAMEARRIENNR